MSRGEGFGDLAEYWSAGLPLTIGGKTYVVPEPSAETGLMCQTLFSAGINVFAATENGTEVAPGIKQMSVLGDDEETNLYVRVLGPTYAAMIKDGVSWAKLRHAGVTAFMWIVINEDAAKAYWQGRPLAMTAPAEPGNRAERRAKDPSSTPTRAARSAKTVSPSTTKSRRTSSESSPAAVAKPSRGSRSSAVGNSSRQTSPKPTALTSTTKAPSKRARGGG